MTLIIEDGTAASASANSFYSIASCAEYLNSKGLTTWAAATTGQEVSLIRAEMWLELLPWKGQKSLSTDPLCWPRRNMYDRDGYVITSTTIPRDVKRAQCEYAYRYFLGKNPFTDVSSGDEHIIREKVGPIEIEKRMGYSAQTKFPEIEKLLEPYLDSSLSVPVERS